MDSDIDVDALIGLVESHPSIWDKSLHEYKIRASTQAAWHDVCAQLNPEYAGFKQTEKSVYGKRVVNKWRNVKDQWLKRLRQVAGQQRTGASKRLMKPYYYHEQLKFLEKCVDVNESEGEDGSSSPIVFNYLPEIIPAQTGDKRPAPAGPETENKKIKTELDDRILFAPLPAEEDPMLLFFRGVLPSTRDFSEDETLEFQSGMLSMIQNIKRSRAYVTNSPDKWTATAVPNPSNHPDPDLAQPSASVRRASRRTTNSNPNYSESYE